MKASKYGTSFALSLAVGTLLVGCGAAPRASQATLGEVATQAPSTSLPDTKASTGVTYVSSDSATIPVTKLLSVGAGTSYPEMSLVRGVLGDSLGVTSTTDPDGNHLEYTRYEVRVSRVILGTQPAEDKVAKGVYVLGGRTQDHATLAEPVPGLRPGAEGLFILGPNQNLDGLKVARFLSITAGRVYVPAPFTASASLAPLAAVALPAGLPGQAVDPNQPIGQTVDLTLLLAAVPSRK